MIQPCKGGLSLRVMLALLTFGAAALSSFAQLGGDFPKIEQKDPGFTMGVQESDARVYHTDVTGAPVINPYANRRNSFSTVRVRGTEAARMGDSTTAVIESGITMRPLFGVQGALGRFEKQAPTNAIVQAGPFFLQANELTGALLVSDNVNFTPNNERWGAIAELRLRLSAILQITPTFRLTVSGNIIYLPFNNQIGVEGFGIGDAFGFVADEAIRPVTHLQLAYNTHWADWEVQMADDFTVNYLVIGGEFDYFVRGHEQPDTIHAEDREGRYVFQNGTTIPTQGVGDRQSDRLDFRVYLQLQNIVAGSASRMLPTETRMSFGASHSDVWFQGNDTAGTNGLGFSNYSVDRVFATLRNERESMRFKPFAFYDAYRYNYDPNWTHQAGAGLNGPITDYLFFHALAGYSWGGSLLKNTEFYRFQLVHTPNPYTWHSISYSRVLTEPVAEIRDTYRYTIHQILGMHLTGRMYLQRSVYQPNQVGVFGSVEDRAAARILYQPTLRHSAIIGGSVAENRFANPARDRQTTWEARAQIFYQYRPTLKFSLLYRYLAIDTKQNGRTTEVDENLWVLSAHKYF
jgi:hypothetical protein